MVFVSLETKISLSFDSKISEEEYLFGVNSENPFHCNCIFIILFSIGINTQNHRIIECSHAPEGPPGS